MPTKQELHSKLTQSRNIIDEKNQLRIIVIGATSGIGLAIARQYLDAGYLVGLTGRRENLLHDVQHKYFGRAYVQVMDISKATLASSQLENLIEKMQGADIIIVNAGVGFVNLKLRWKKQAQTIDVNVTGFTALSSTAMKYFMAQGKGQLVGISSIAGLRGSDLAPDYAASKAYVSNYLAGLRKKAVKAKLPIYITDVLPGFVDTPMGQSEQRFWVASSEKAGKQIINAIQKKHKVAYITKRWRLIAWLIHLLPDWIYNRI